MKLLMKFIGKPIQLLRRFFTKGKQKKHIESARPSLSEAQQKKIEEFKKNIAQQIGKSPASQGQRENVRKNHGGGRKEKTKHVRPEDGLDDHQKTPDKIQPASTQKKDQAFYASGKTFSDYNLDEKVKKIVRENGFTKPTKVQDRSIPEILAGSNIFCSSETGSGKTLAFTIPLLDKLVTKNINQALILSPTREIAIQTKKVFDQLNFDSDIEAGLVIGGFDMAAQKAELKKYPPVLIATPGRLLDMMEQGYVWLEYTDYVVLDEADRMLDMGFEPDLIRIHEALPGTQQTLLYSATMFPEVKKVAERYSSDYKEIIVGKPRAIAGTVKHYLIPVSNHEKFQVLKKMVTEKRRKMIVFFNTIKETRELSDRIRNQGHYYIGSLHSGKSQEMRERIISDFRSGKLRVLFGTDVAARGIDIPNVELVVNYGLPNNTEEYIHRVGRTGRAGDAGLAVTLFTDRDKRSLPAVEKMIKCKIEKREKI